MPLTHLACPETAPSYGEAHPPEHCVTECRHRCLSPFLLAGLMASNKSNHHKGKLLSVTSLTTGGCTRSLVYERTLDYADVPLSNMYAYRGTLAHQVIEDASGFKFPHGASLEDMGFLTEQRMLIGFCFAHGGFKANKKSNSYDESTWHHTSCPTCNKLKIQEQDRQWFFLSGTLDGFEPHWHDFDPYTGTLPGTIHDNKTAMEYAIDAIISGKDTDSNVYKTPYKDGYVEQLNLYKYLLRQVEVPAQIKKAAKARGVTVKRLNPTRLCLQFISMGKFPLSGQPYMFSNHYTKPKTPHVLPDLPVFDDSWAEAHIKQHGYGPYLGLILGNSRPKICAPEDNSKGAHHWKCGTPDGQGSFCSFAYSEHCPSPSVEWAALQEGLSEDEAFARAEADRAEGHPSWEPPEKAPKKAKKAST